MNSTDFKICPIMTLLGDNKESKNCTEESCAWYDSSYDKCSIVVISTELFNLTSELENMKGDIKNELSNIDSTLDSKLDDIKDSIKNE